MTFIQAYADDSACDTGDKRLFIAGYVQRADVWAEFDDAWDAALQESPRIAFLHMVEANNLRGEFNGWDAKSRDRKIIRLASVVRKFPLVAFRFSIPRDVYFRKLTPVSPRGITPDFTCTLLTTHGIGRVLHDKGIDIPIRFIFDSKEGTSADVQLLYENSLNALDEGVRKLISKAPTFEDDTQFKPLQAADMLAWHIRRDYEKTNSFCRKIMKMIGGEYIICGDYPEHVIMENAAEFAQLPVFGPQSKQKWQEFRKLASKMKASGFKPLNSDSLVDDAIHFHKFLEKMKRGGEI